MFEVDKMLEMMKEEKCVSTGKDSINRTARIWRVKLNGKSMIFNTPRIFAVYSMWGNQWLKLLLFFNVWYNEIDLLFSLFDILMATKQRREKCFELGIRKFTLWQLSDYASKVKQELVKKYPAYQDYLDFLHIRKEPPFIKNLIMVDSGGFSLDSKLSVSKIHNVGFSLNKIDQTQKSFLKAQLSMKPDIVLTLDRVIKNPNKISINEKRRRVEFSLECAKAALRLKGELKDRKEKFGSLLFGVVHPYGPKINKVSDELVRKYKENCDRYLSELLDYENEVGVFFDGFAIGSLIPLPVSLVKALGDFISKKIRQERKNVILHALGVTNTKMLELLECGFDTFDTNSHVQLAKYRYYLESINRPIKIDELKKLKCNCPVCSTFSLKELRERRRGVKEVSTVLISLHNFFKYRNNLIFANKE
jgi:queuine/archaeosine tRNA-ribosyltransferase